MKNEKGITLIALIITIIVMLILVGVTINVAVNGGIFDKAKKAREDTQRESDKEQILSAVVASIDNDGTVDEEELIANTPEGFTYLNGVFTNNTTGKKYEVNLQTGKITEVTSSNSESSENQGNSGNNENSGNSGNNENSGNSGNTEPAEGTYSFTLGDIAENGSCPESMFLVPKTSLLSNEELEELEDSITLNTENGSEPFYYFNNIECSNSNLINLSSEQLEEINSESNGYFLCLYEDYIVLSIKVNNIEINNSNYQEYSAITFTITK